jgi:hypothetical protein
MKHEINPVLHSFGHSVLTLLYITGVALFMSHTKDLFGAVKEPNFLIPVGMLLLLVVSATVTGTLVLAKPILLYLDGHKREGLKFFGMTVGWLALITVIVFVVLSFQI